MSATNLAIKETDLDNFCQLASLGNSFEVLQADSGEISIIREGVRYAIQIHYVVKPFCDYAEQYFLDEKDRLRELEEQDLELNLVNVETGATEALRIKAKLNQKSHFEKTALIVTPEILKGFICKYKDSAKCWIIGRPFSKEILKRIKPGASARKIQLISREANTFFEQNTSPHLTSIPVSFGPPKDQTV